MQCIVLQERRRRRLSHDLTPIRTSQTQWPVRPLRASVPLQTSPHWKELEVSMVSVSHMQLAGFSPRGKEEEEEEGEN